MAVEHHVTPSEWTELERNTTPWDEASPLERVVLGVRNGHTASALPPVRIFLGTETGQFRAERVFVWSIEQLRDPSRVYEITLMKELPGFDRRKWLTGFTNYRFAIPELAGRTGRAIYNDVDQIYLSDPADLFDTPMGEHGFLSISDRDTSVMLIDCARMARLWTIEAARSRRRKKLEAMAREIPGLWGRMDGGWNARDEEYQAGQSHLIHYTIIHSQPWRPFPQRFVYQRNPIAEVWQALERAADAAGYQLFSAAEPSNKFRTLAMRCRSRERTEESQAAARPPLAAAPGGTKAAPWQGLQDLMAQTNARQLLHYTLGPEVPATMRATDPAAADWTACNPLLEPSDLEAARNVDGTVCSALLEYLPDEDVPWVLNQMFDRAQRFVFVVVDGNAGPLELPDGSQAAPRERSRSWWDSVFELPGMRHPQIHWRLLVREHASPGRTDWAAQGGGRSLAATPKVWVLADDKTGHNIQSEGLARTLGWPYEVKRLRFNHRNRLSNELLGASLRSLDRNNSDPLDPPWPDLVISTGRREAPIARWIGRQSQGGTRLVHLGRKGGETADQFDLVVSCSHFRQPYHPRRMETLVPLNNLGPAELRAAADHWRGLFADAPAPHLALVVGGPSALHRLGPASALRIGREVARFAETLGGSVFAITSPRTGERATQALREGLGEQHSVYAWEPNDPSNPYLGYLALADILVVTGESESMLSEAATTGKPLLIYPLPDRRPGLRARVAEAVVRISQAPRYNKRGTIKPQRGLQYWCARLIDRGWVRPRRDLNKMHAALVASGVAQMFGSELKTGERPRLAEARKVAERIRRLMGFAGEA